ncbi:patatin-like phospholipase family protein [Klenkia soli]|uniref:patatin-like phospholipase family protein n=1 Tax=Klenkia soli TaxID=1052260 RepID=UPI000B8606AC|nr:patatin-like phospholipase family protein [Klenkia soli]
MTRALVLGGGGVAGVAWETGLLLGLAEAGGELAADVVVGTSAGATTAAQLTSGVGLPELHRRQSDPAAQVAELVPTVSLMALLDEITARTDGLVDPADRRRAIGALALAADTPSPAARRAVIAARLAGAGWPADDLRITAVDAVSGDVRVFTAADGVDLVDAVAASCAVPGIWSPVEIEGRRYVDGGAASTNHADLAAGATAVLVLSPMQPDRAPELADEVARLRDTGADVEVVHPDEASVVAIGPDPLDPAVRTASAQAGRRQAAGLSLRWTRPGR